MAVGRSEETALGSARGRFLESLPRKAIELRGTIALLTATPSAEGPRGEMRRKLHALYASALVFRSDALAALVQEGIGRLDAATEQHRALEAADLEALSSLVKRLAELRSEERFSAPPPARSSTVPGPASAPPLSARSPEGALRQETPAAVSISATPSAAPESGEGAKLSGARRSATLTGLLPVGVPVATPSEMPGRWVTRASSFPPTIERDRLRTPTFQRVLHVLVVTEQPSVTVLCDLLSAESLRVTASTSAREALASALDDAPDVVLAEARLAFEGGLLAGLRADPLTDFVPLVVIAAGDAGNDTAHARNQGADEVVTRPLRAEQLWRVLGRVTGTLVETSVLQPAPQEATIDEVCARVTDEIRRGLIDATESGRDLRVPLGEGAEIMAAAWAAVARVRAVFSERSSGRVRFNDRPSFAAPSLLSLSSSAEELASLAGESPLSGRRILVADDDTAVVLFFAGLLREEGAYVTEVTDGAEALRAARRERPDLVISDVVMPGLDGFALCRELKRDPLLADVPVILISWKEDLLVRMRELASGASGYLRKEASAAQILSSVREALRSRGQLEARLAEPGEVRGSLDGTGVVALMRSVRRARPDARVSLRDAWNLFECELRDGRLAQLTRTASDGSFVRNDGALPQLLGISSGRYAVSTVEGPLKQALDGTLDEVLARGARELGAQLDVLNGPALAKVGRVVLDEDAQAALLGQATPLVRDVVERLTQGVSPAELWSNGILEQPMLEAMLVDMAKRGSLRSVLGRDGEDLIAEARAERERQPATELQSPMSLLPPAPVPVISMLPMEPAPQQETTGAGVIPTSNTIELPSSHFPPSEPGLVGSPISSMLPPAPVEGEPLGDEPVQSSDTSAAETAAPAPEQPAAAEVPREDPEPPMAVVPIRSDARELDRAATEARNSRGTLWAWVAAFVALMGVAFLADRAREPDAGVARVEAIGAAPQEPAPSAKPVAPVVEASREDVVAAPPQAGLVSAEEGGFTIYDRILDESVKVGPKEALVVVEAGPADDGAQLTIDGKSVGSLPAKAALSEGIHELAITRGDTVTYRFLAPRGGSSWVLREP